MDQMTADVLDPQHTDNRHSQATAGSLERLFARISEVSSLPHVAIRIFELANDPRTGAEDLLEAVRSDPALAMRVMRTVNSSYYALDSKVGNLKQAITLLGFDEIRNLALTAYVSPLFKQGEGHGQYTRHGLWDHMIAAGMIGRLIANTRGRIPPQEAYLAGLLHDVGLVLIDQYLHKWFRKIVDELTEDASVCDVERKYLGFDHTDLGQYVAAKWSLPEHLSTAVGHHHNAGRYQGPHRQLVCLVALADFLCHWKGVPPLGVCNAQMPPAELFNDLGLSRDQVAAIVNQLDDVLTDADTMAAAQLR